LPSWAILVVLLIMAVGGFALGNWCERRFGGPLTADEVIADLAVHEGGPGDRDHVSEPAQPNDRQVIAS
ncbi:MAG: hypothetical protein ACR2QH_07655, partial [Geminicoccaceae bacterium]